MNNLNNIWILTSLLDSPLNPSLDKPEWEQQFYQREPLGHHKKIGINAFARHIAVYSVATMAENALLSADPGAQLCLSEIQIYHYDDESGK